MQIPCLTTPDYPTFQGRNPTPDRCILFLLWFISFGETSHFFHILQAYYNQSQIF